MEAAHRYLPADEQYPLPPREITEVVTQQATQGPRVAAGTTTALTYLAHFGMGSAAGTLYGVAAPLLPGSSLVRGIGYGLCVWAGNYLGLLPALDILRPATEHPPQRNELMIAAHILWGATLSMIADQVLDHDGA